MIISLITGADVSVQLWHRVRGVGSKAWHWRGIKDGDWIRTTKNRGKVLKIQVLMRFSCKKEDLNFFIMDFSSSPSVSSSLTSLSLPPETKSEGRLRKFSGRIEIKRNQGVVIEEGLKVLSVEGPQVVCLPNAELTKSDSTRYLFEAKAKLCKLCKSLVICVVPKTFVNNNIYGSAGMFSFNVRENKRTNEQTNN